MGIDAIGDALQLLPVLPLNVWPHHVLRGIAKELPVFLAFVCLFEDGDLQSVSNLRRQQVAILKADLVRRAFQMHEGPAVILGSPESALQLAV
jgi:hypothetical protein